MTGGMRYKRWELLGKGSKDIVDVLLENRGLKNKKEKLEFLNSKHPFDIKLSDIGVKKEYVIKAIKRLERAKNKKEKIYIYGDYDADGVCSTAVLWEALYSLGFDVMPYIPERFTEGYGLGSDAINKLKIQNPKLKLVISVDNGIVANDEIDKINKLGIDVIVIDHHEKGKKLPQAHAIIHTTKVCATALAWIFSREVIKNLEAKDQESKIEKGLDLAGIATIADQMPLIGNNRSFAKWGLEALSESKRPGLTSLYKESGIIARKITSYDVNYIIAPRINASGRLGNAIHSLRLLCTKDPNKADNLAGDLGAINLERQKIVEEVVLHAKGAVGEINNKKVIILAHESYHEGVIGLAAAKLVEEFYRPSIVMYRGAEISKGSARSIYGFNMIKAINKFSHLLEAGGGHSMAAGFSIKTKNIEKFILSFEKEVGKTINEEMLSPKLKIDTKIEFDAVSEDLWGKIKGFEPHGLGNQTPSFLTEGVEVLELKVVGREKNHLKLVLRQKSKVFGGIVFSFAKMCENLKAGQTIDVVYNITENLWNNQRNIELKIKDIKQ